MKTTAIEKACIDAHKKFQKLNMVEFNEIKSKLAYVIGSYNFDKNPVGLYEIGAQALDILKTIKQKKPRSINKKLLTDLENALQTQHK